MNRSATEWRLKIWLIFPLIIMMFLSGWRMDGSDIKKKIYIHCRVIWFLTIALAVPFF